MSKILKEFKDFVMQGNLIELAVAFVIGIAFAAVLTALVTDIITPIIAAIAGKTDFSALSFSIHKSRFLYGDFINALVTFVSIAAAVFFFVVKPYNYIQSKRQTGEEPAPPPAPDVALLTEIRDLLRARA